MCRLYGDPIGSTHPPNGEDGTPHFEPAQPKRPRRKVDLARTVGSAPRNKYVQETVQQSKSSPVQIVANINGREYF